jgi:hypothetical protein
MKFVLMKKVLFGVVLMCFATVAFSQNTRNVNTQKAPAPQYQSAKKEKRKIFSFLRKKESNKSEVEKFRERVSDVYKQKAKEAKRADKAQYNDPSYFGHKRPPKKRKPGKMKFCKTCGIKH